MFSKVEHLTSFIKTGLNTGETSSCPERKITQEHLVRHRKIQVAATRSEKLHRMRHKESGCGVCVQWKAGFISANACKLIVCRWLKIFFLSFLSHSSTNTEASNFYVTLVSISTPQVLSGRSREVFSRNIWIRNKILFPSSSLLWELFLCITYHLIGKPFLIENIQKQIIE